MTLGQMYALANGKSGYSRSDTEIYAALNRAGQRVYNAVLKEFRGFFIKFDETSLTLVPGTSEYALPADLTQIVHLAERLTSTNDWAPMAPEELGSALTNLQNAAGWSDFYSSQYGAQSAFGFYGPYLDATATVGTQTQKIRVSPAVDTSRFCQIAYTAKWLPITNAGSPIMLPDEGTPTMESWASGELCGMSDDSRSAFYMSQGDKDLQGFLSWLRARQIMAPLNIETYGPGN